MVKGPIFGFFLEVGPKYGNVCHMSTFIRIVSSKGSSRSGSEMCPCRPDAAPPRPAPARGLVRARPQPRHRHRLRQRHDEVARDSFTQPRHPQPPNTANDYEKIGFHYFN